MSHDENQELEIMYQQRQQRCEQAIERAELGQATQEDFDIIRFECGLKKSQINKETSDALDVFFGDINYSLNNLTIRK